MDWFQPMDIYCERLGPEFWAEPLNAWSNGSFLVAAAVAFYFAWRAGRIGPANLGLIALAALVGIGSFLFHTFANRWSDIADIVPIWTFVFVYVLVAMHDFFAMPWLRVARIGVIIAVVAGLVFWLMPAGTDNNETLLNGSEQYIPAVIGLIALAVLLGRQRHAAAPYVWAGTGVFALSLVFRTLDQTLCSSLPMGTHFGWHLCNGLLLGLLLVALVRHGEERPKAAL
ncbi:MAG: ceramidase domain-containing protein [Alphaproteobacteria bacterium]|nr:ceramidase domain-containing protein [Alphaproteobacteria bacterium]